MIFCTRLLLHRPPLFQPIALGNSRIYFDGILKKLSLTNCSPAPFATLSTDFSGNFTWDDVLRISQSFADDPSLDLRGFFEKIRMCNRGSELKSQFTPFVIQDQIVGFIHDGFADHLRRFHDVIIFPNDGHNDSKFDHFFTLHPRLRTPDDITRAFAGVINSLGENLIPGIRNELYPVMSTFGARAYFSLERAAAPYFGIKAYGVHMNGYVEKEGQTFMWIGKRSRMKQTYPGMLDHLVAGGLPHGMSCKQNLMKECVEEAGIPRSIAKEAIPVGIVSYIDIDGHRFKRDVLFCYDLRLPEDFIPTNQDGEVEGFKLFPVSQVANIVKRTHIFKPNCSLVIIDFLFRHGYIKPEEPGYLKLFQCLRSGDCT